jgi:hypothetical protein
VSSSGNNPPDGSSQDPRVDDLRQRLRALGYLDAGVDRFVLGSARRSDGPAAIALFASLRIGALAAVLLGPAAAIGLAGRLPGLITGPRDAIVAAVYFGVFFGAFIAAVAFLSALTTAWAATNATVNNRTDRRTRMLAVAAGVIVTAGCLTYLTLWWRTANGGLGWSSPLWTAFALVVAAGISLLLGHAVTLTALALTMARPERALPARPVRHWSWKAPILGGAIAFAGAAALLLATTGAETSRAVPSLTVRSSGARVLVLAIDGFDAQVQERLRAESRISGAPTLFTVFDGAHAELSPTDSRDPARLWTTIATGVRPETHGVDSLETRRVAGLQGRVGSGSTGRMIGAATDVLRLTRPSVASNFERRVKTFWEVAEQAGLRTAVINWWATWPAAATAAGVVLSDRAILRLERGGPLDAELAPPDLYQHLRDRWSEIRSHAQSLAQTILSGVDAPHSVAPPANVASILTRSAELDATVMGLAQAVASPANLDLLVVYLPGLDIAQHTLLGGDSPAPSELEGRLSGLQQYYRFLNALTGTQVWNWFQGTRIFVITQPGRLHQGPGHLAAIGPGVRHGTQTSGTVLGVAPTILHALGVPVSRELDGRVIDRMLQSDFLNRYPVQYVDTYGLRGVVAAQRGGAPLDQEMIDRLRSLGYVK